MPKPRSGAAKAAPFFISKNTELTSSRGARAARKRRRACDILPGFEREVSRAKGEPERSVECKAIVAIAGRGIFVVKHTVEACYRCHAKPNKRAGLGRGASDLFCLVDGRACFIEMKKAGYSPSDVSDDQRRWLEMVRKHGAVAGVASSVEEALALVDEARRPS